MSKVVNKSQFKRASVLSALSIVMLSGCQSTGIQSQQADSLGIVTKTEMANLLPESRNKEWLQVAISEPIQFEVPLEDTVSCGIFDTSTKGKKGTLHITKVESFIEHGVEKSKILGFVSSDELDISKCYPYFETYPIVGSVKVKRTATYSNTVLPELVKLTKEQRELKKKAKEAADKAAVEKQKQAQLANWHEKELADTAFAIAGVEVCMEKGTYFFPPNRQAKKVLNDWQSYAKNDIHSKVDGKHYYDKSVYQQRRQAALKLLRYSWENDYLSFSNMCASLRNAVDSQTNK
ncbi:hypothetical protein ACUVHH_16735 [Vibrio parahaemolyticus]|uniref:hypothetical protein n=1 Tax=Vibrio parahaemolyticus TaxID=670 RepID=UPI0034E2A503